MQILKILEGYDIGSLGFGTAENLHLLAESFKIAFADRADYSGDPEVVDVPVDRLTSSEYGASRRNDIDISSDTTMKDFDRCMSPFPGRDEITDGGVYRIRSVTDNKFITGNPLYIVQDKGDLKVEVRDRNRVPKYRDAQLWKAETVPGDNMFQLAQMNNYNVSGAVKNVPWYLLDDSRNAEIIRTVYKGTLDMELDAGAWRFERLPDGAY